MAKNQYQSAIDKANADLDKMYSKWDAIDKKILEISKNARNSTGQDFNSGMPKDLNDRLKKNVQFNEQLNKVLDEQKLQIKALQDQIAKLNETKKRGNKLTVSERENRRVVTAQKKLQYRAETELLGAYSKLSARLTVLRKRYLDLGAQKIKDGQLTKKQEAEYQRLGVKVRRLDASLKSLDSSVGRSQRNVGNYGIALKGLGNTFRQLASAFGFTSAVFLFAQGVQDAIKRVREFDKSMQNLAGVFRTTRKDLAPLEETIINVAGVTVRTSNEVAKLAETLATLGKSPDQIKNLLKPVIDLSLGLDAASDEAGEFLVQMLNAFGGTDAEAAKYADTIATIRTSTTLDFQKMRDSFQYIAPISRILGKDLAYTGSVVGILADNSLKAEQAGRLLSTAQIKLATQGRTLEEALQEINQAYKEGADGTEILSIANESFGKQAAKVGAILALNTDAIDLNAQAIRDNGGALKDLTDRQLESVDAKIKILDSSYERFILTLEKGDGVASRKIAKFIENISDNFTNLSLILGKNTTTFEKWKLGVNNVTSTLSALAPWTDKSVGLFEEFAEQQRQVASATGEALAKLEEENLVFIKLYGSLAPLTKEMQKMKETKEELNLLFGSTLLAGVTKEKRSVGFLNAEIKLLNDEILELGETDIASIRIKQRKIKELEKERDAILGVVKKTKQVSKAIKGSIAKYEELISAMKKTRSQTATTNQSWGAQTKAIEKTEEAVEKLRIQFEGLGRVQQKTLAEGVRLTESQKRAQEQLAEAGKKSSDELADDFQRNIDNAIRQAEAVASINLEAIDKIASGFGALNDLSSAFAQNEFDRIDEKTDRNNGYYANLLDNERLTQSQRDALEAERDAKNIELQKKREEAERKAFLISQAFALAQIGIDLARTIVAINLAAAAIDAISFGTGGLAYRAANIPFAIGTAAAQVAVVAAQTIPQFKDGHLEGTHSGLALINDAATRDYQEVVERKDGRLEMFSGRNTLIDMDRGDKVHKAGTFDVNKIIGNTINMSMLDQQDKITRAQQNQLNLASELQKAFSGIPQPNVTANFNGATAKEIGKATANELYKLNRAHSA